MKGELQRAARRRRTPELLAGFWFITSLVALAGLLLGIALVAIDKVAGNAGALPTLIISPDSARTILGSIAGSLITIASLTSSLTIVTLQLLSSQYTPRAIRGFLSTRLSQIVLGTFVGVFLFCLVALVAVREPGDENAPFVPSLTIIVSVLLAVVGLIMLVVFIHSMSQTIQVSTMTARVSRDTYTAIATVHGGATQELEPADAVADEDPISVVLSPRAGYVRDIDFAALAADLAGPTTVEVLVRTVDFVTPGTRIARVTTAPAHRMGVDVETAIRQAVDVERERDIRTDPGYGIRQLVDIALRALSPGINDPSTAVTCVGYLRALLEDLAARTLPPRVAVRRGDVVVSGPAVCFDDYLAPVIEIASYAAGDARVVLTLLDALHSVARCADDTERAEQVSELRDEIKQAALQDVRLLFDRDRIERSNA